jgi:transcriptional regulator with XRE-family HTH domain
MTQDERAFFMSFGWRIASLRKAQGLTQAQLGELLGVSQQPVTSFEVARRRVPVSLLPTLAKALAVSVEELVNETPRPASVDRPPSSSKSSSA